MTQAGAQAGPVISFLDNPHAPEVFITDASGFHLHEGVVTVALESARIDHATSPGPINRVVVGRVSMPLGAAMRMAVSLYDFLKQMGHDPADVIQTAGDPSRPQ